MDLTNVAGFALVGSILAFFNQIKAGVYRVFSVFIRTDTVDTGYLQQDAIQALIDQSRIIRWGNVTWTSQGWLRSQVYGIDVPVVTRKEESLLLLWRGRIPLRLKAVKNGFSVTYLWKTFDARQLFELGYDQRAKRDAGQAAQRAADFYVRDISGEDTVRNSLSETKAPESAKDSAMAAESSAFYYAHLRDKTDYLCHTFDQLANAPSIPQIVPVYHWSTEAKRLRDEVGYWLNNGEWFRTRQIPQRRSSLLTGGPGTGKSKMVLEVARHHGVPVLRINLANMTDNEFRRAYSDLPGSHCLILIEDIDAVFDQRVNVLAGKSLSKNLLSFDTLINVIGGVNPHGGVFLVVTANHPERLDPALVRPGRLDVHIEVGPLDEQGKRTIASNILRDERQALEELVAAHPRPTAAAFENACICRALEIFYSRGPSRNQLDSQANPSTLTRT